MQVMLKQKIDDMGRKGDIVEVSAELARELIRDGLVQKVSPKEEVVAEEASPEEQAECAETHGHWTPPPTFGTNGRPHHPDPRVKPQGEPTLPPKPGTKGGGGNK